MADLTTLVTILPTQQVQSATPVAQGGTSQTGSLLSGVPSGTVLQGFIVNRDASGNPVLRTDKGDIPFSTAFFLKIGSEVVIRVGNTGGQTLAHILSVDGQPPEVAENISGFSQEPEIILGPHISSSGTAAAATTATDTLAPSLTNESAITVTGTVIPGQPSATPAALPLIQPADPGTQLTLKIITLTAPASPIPQEIIDSVAPAVQPGASQASPAFYATYARAAGPASPFLPTADTTPVTTPATAPANTPPQPSGTIPPPTSPEPVNAQELPLPAVTTEGPAPATTSTEQLTPFSTVVVNTPATPTAAPATAIPAPVTPSITPSMTLSATVLGNESSGEALVQTPLGVIRLQQGITIPAGSNVTFEVVQSTPPAPQNISGASFPVSQPAPLTELAQQWNSLQQIFSLLPGRSTATGLDTLLSATSFLPVIASNPPAPPEATAQNISSSLMLFIAALRGGDFQNWLGDSNIRLLEAQGHGDLLKKAQTEFTALARQFTEPAPHQWQSLFLPSVYDGSLHQVRIFVKRDRRQSATQRNAREDEETRFVIEVDLTQLGEIQMDGFVQKQDKSIQFDMMIRSLNALPKTIQDDILKIYNDMGMITGYKGTMSFQAVKEFPVNPMQDIVASGNTVTV